MTEQPQNPEPAGEEPATEIHEPVTEVTPTAATPEAAAAAAAPDPAPIAAVEPASEPASTEPAPVPAGAEPAPSISGAGTATDWRPPDPPTPPWSPSDESGSSLLDERPEVGVGAAFAGGFVLAMILKRLAR